MFATCKLPYQNRESSENDDVTVASQDCANESKKIPRNHMQDRNLRTEKYLQIFLENRWRTLS